MESSSDIILPIAIGIGLMLLLSLAFVLFFYFSQGKMRKEQLKVQRAKLEYQENLLYTTILTQEKERERIAKDLHDSVGAKLSAIHLYMHQLTKKAPEAQSVITEMVQAINDTMDTTRRISYDLLPPALENFGLQTAIEELCDHLQQVNSISIYFEASGDRSEHTEKLVTLNMFRILQELLNNTLKYAEADFIQVKLWQSPEKLLLEYRDNGCGFDPALIENQKGLGMQNIQSRLQMIGGSYTLKTAIGEGVEVQIEVNQKANA